MSPDARVQMTVRLRVDDKEFFATATERCGIEASVAARQILELLIQRLRVGGDFLDALHELKTTWRAPLLQRELEEPRKALTHPGPADAQEALLRRIEEIERTLREGGTTSGRQPHRR
jgi:hypothetical protein